MRIVLIGLLAAHGIAHLVGVLSPWGLVPASPDARAADLHSILGGRVRLGAAAGRAASVLWLLGAAGFVVAAVGVLTRSDWQLAALASALLFSLVLTAVWLPVARIGLMLNVAIALGLAVAAFVAYRQDMREARARVAVPTQRAMTPFGTIEFVERGTGDPVLLVHGTGGGFDQGLFAAGALETRGFRLISPSRLGYLGTPMREDASPALEADLFAALLDSLGITRAAVISFSAGTAPAVQLALRHPDRVSRLVLVVPAAGGMVPVEHPNPPPSFIMKVALRSDLPMWLTSKLAPAAIHRLVAVPPALVAQMSPEERAELARGEATLFPVSARYRGTLYDASTQSGREPAYPLERVRAPTLLVSAADDLYNTLPNARAMARRIPEAEVLAVPTGGHLLVGQGDAIWPRVAEFLRQSP